MEWNSRRRMANVDARTRNLSIWSRPRMSAATLEGSPQQPSDKKQDKNQPGGTGFEPDFEKIVVSVVGVASAIKSRGFSKVA